jgi:hypothetical protein
MTRLRLEHCKACDSETGKAGRDDDSLYLDSGDGPYCDDCWDDLPFSVRVVEPCGESDDD